MKCAPVLFHVPLLPFSGGSIPSPVELLPFLLLPYTGPPPRVEGGRRPCGVDCCWVTWGLGTSEILHFPALVCVFGGHRRGRACVRACCFFLCVTVSLSTWTRMEQVALKVLKKKLNLPGHLGAHTHSLLKGLLTRDPDRRLGCKGTHEVVLPRVLTQLTLLPCVCSLHAYGGSRNWCIGFCCKREILEGQRSGKVEPALWRL